MLELAWPAGAVGAFAVALVLSAFLSCAAAAVVRRLGIGQHIREDGPKTHLAKEGTPQMAGIGFVVAIVLTAAVTGIIAARDTLSIVALMCAFALIGFADDYLKAVKRSPYGWDAKYRVPLQVIIGSVFVGLTHMAQPGPIDPNAFWAYLFGVFVVVGGSNAVNLTDGLDGLAAGITVIVAGTLAVAAGVLAKAPELVALAAIIAGAAGGFLWINAPPARAFMGDVGSMALGASLCGLAVALDMEIIFGILAFIFVFEALSVIGQVISFQTTGRRIFRMAPFHHHLEQCGWPETRIVVRAWVLSALVGAAVIAWLLMTTAGGGGVP